MNQKNNSHKWFWLISGVVVLIIILAIVGGGGKLFQRAQLSQQEDQPLASETETYEESLLKSFLEDPLSTEPELRGMPGIIDDTGVYFEFKDSRYLNITLKSSEEIKVFLESVPKMISLMIETTGNASSTLLILENLTPNKTYYKYEDGYENLVVFVSDRIGRYSWRQDLSKLHHVWLQEEKSTVFLPADCSTYGTWDATTTTCILNQDLNQSIQLTNNNLTLDCNSHNIVGSGTGYGIYAPYRSGVTIKNCVVDNFSNGILFPAPWKNNTIYHNTVTNSQGNWGIGLTYMSPSNTINHNRIEWNKGFAIYVYDPRNNTITHNTILHNEGGIVLYGGFDNNVTENIVDLNLTGINIHDSRNTTLTGNEVSSSTIGLYFYYSAVNPSSDNILRDNVLSNNQYNIGFNPSAHPGSFIQDIDQTNTINGKPIYYLVNQTNKTISTEPGFVALVNCQDITIKDLTLTDNYEGLILVSTTDSKVENIQIPDNRIGILSMDSSRNSFKGNQISSTAQYGAGIWFSSSADNVVTDNDIRLHDLAGVMLSSDLNFNNKFYHNNFIDNRFQVYSDGGSNLFDNGYPDGGNYWSDYRGQDLYSGPRQNQPGSDGIIDTPYSFRGGQDRYPFMEENGWGPPQPDFSIKEIKPVQVVWDPDINDDGKIDLVAGKSTMVRIYIGMENYEELDKQQIIEVQLTFEGLDYVATSTIEQLEENNKQIDFYPTSSPTILGDQTVTAKIDPEDEIEEANETNNEKPIGITVKDTRDLHLGYTRIYSTQPAGYGIPSFQEFQDTVDASGELIKATYPVSEEKFINEVNPKYEDYEGDPAHFLGMMEDILSLAVLKVRSRIDRSVGIVPQYYFTYHGLCNVCGCAKGVKLKGVNWTALIEVGYWTASAHEIGHTYGLHRDEEEYVFNEEACEITYKGNSANGFWVNKGKPIEDSICFMGSAPPKYHFDRWVCNECYKNLFRKFRLHKDDPKTLILSGLISKDGTIEFRKSYYLSNGILEYPTPGDYLLQLIDQTGAIIQEISFGDLFEMYVEPFGILPVDSAPFVFAIPYPENTSKIQIWYNEEILAEINPNNKLLHDAVDSIPDHGFINRPEQRRNSFHNIINAVEKMLEKDNFKGAVNNLKFDIKDKFEKWLIDGYEVENPLQLSKVEIIELVDVIIERLNLILEGKN